jgi:hypothetical protein
LAIRKDKKEQQLKKKRQGCINNTKDHAFTESSGIAFSQDDPNNSITSNCSTATNARIPSVNDLPKIKEVLLSPTSLPYDKIEATRGIRRLLSLERNSPVSEVVDQGLLPILIRNLTDDPSETTLIFESEWAITNIASTNRAKDVSDAGGIRPLISLMTHEDHNIRDQAIWCLGNIAGEGPDMRESLLQSGIVQPL